MNGQPGWQPHQGQLSAGTPQQTPPSARSAGSGPTAAMVAAPSAQSVPETGRPVADPQPAEQEATETSTDASQAAATAQPVAIGQAAAAAPTVPPAPGGPPRGPAPASDWSSTESAWHVRKHRALPRLRTGRHVAGYESLELIQLTGSTVGLSIGKDQSGAPVTVALFRPTPMRCALIGGVWAARLVAYRALRFGARLVIVTDRPGDWQDLGRLATGRIDRVALLPPGIALDTSASGDAPVLRVIDVESAVEPTTEVDAWLTELTVLRQFRPDRTDQVRRADLVLTQRLTPDESAGMMSVYGTPERTAYTLQVLHDDMVAVLADDTEQYAWLALAEYELDALGQARR
ncbi:hypothetical protein EV191_104141 [Tamaricihabitans halophyticus]|uniref:Uncharacterized protein n=1 Tax=Tamaricihabitans halophyticus TaxID=1262583 RepID=A0A4R2QWD1_9PSEU|nr:hypothetical protein [Tamaricihabitans halophyticus]TCP53574.1 hypothetical protein EV191_104141 [Tamaricihabitans halophyticus]